MVIDLVVQQLPVTGDRRIRMQADIVIPLVKRPQAKMLLDGGKERISLHPAGLRFPKRSDGGRIALKPAGKCPPQHLMARAKDAAKVHMRLIVAPIDGFHFFGQQQPVLDQQVEIDEIRVAGKRGRALVGGIAIAGRPERQHLPVALPGSDEKVRKSERRLPERPHAVRGRQRGDVHQGAATAFHGFLKSPLFFHVHYSIIVL